MRQSIFLSLFVIMTMNAMDSEPSFEDVPRGSYTIRGIGYNDEGMSYFLSRKEEGPSTQFTDECDDVDKIACLFGLWGMLKICGVVP